MKSKLVILSLLLSGATIANAQTKEKYYSESWKDNFFISVGVGGQVVTNPSNFDYGFGESITPLVNISLGKFFSPVWGIRGQVAGWSGKLHTQYPFENVGKDENWYNYKKKFVALNADAMLNLTNLFCGYKEGRKFEFMFFVGPTLNISNSYSTWNLATKTTEVTNADGSLTYKQELDPSKSYPKDDKVRLLVGASLGLGAKYNIDQKWAIDLEARGTVSPSVFGSVSDATPLLTWFMTRHTVWFSLRMAVSVMILFGHSLFMMSMGVSLWRANVATAINMFGLPVRQLF